VVAQPFIRIVKEVNIGGPITNGVMDTIGHYSLKTISFLLLKGSGNHFSNVDKSIDDIIDEDVEIP